MDGGHKGQRRLTVKSFGQEPVGLALLAGITLAAARGTRLPVRGVRHAHESGELYVADEAV